MTHDELIQSCSDVIRTMYEKIDTRLAEADPWEPDQPKRIKFQEFATAIHQLADLLEVNKPTSAA